MSDIVKSELDKRLYKFIKLENDIKVLLISDAEADKMACSLDVNIGQLCDPTELPGLAHFLEHMLFLGTKKYPDENAYSSFIQSHGGMENAYTSLEHTNYSFDLLDSDSFEEALDRFAQFFISPLFTESASSREIEAVNNENAKNLQSDIWRLYQLCRSISDPEHPFSKFGSGNKFTLSIQPSKNGIDVRKALLKFHETYYSGNLMTLCVLSKHSLDELEVMVRDKFSGVKNFQKEIPNISNEPFSKIYGLGHIYKIVPVKDEQHLKLSWQFKQSLEKYYHEKPDLILSHIIGYEGKGSLLSYLKSKSYATNLYSGCDSSCGTKEFCLFVIDIELTTLGFEHYNEIITFVYSYINLLVNASDEEWTRLFKELQQLQAINFKFKPKEKPYNLVTTLSEKLHLYPPNEILTGPNLLKKCDINLLRNCMQNFAPDNMIIFVTSKTFKNIVDLEELWYRTKYNVTKLSDEEKKLFITTNKDILKNELFLPEPNPFISDNFDLYCDQNNENKENNLYPKKIYESEKSRLWYKMDDVYRKPRANIIFSIFSSRAFANVKASMLTIMYINMLEDFLNEFSYPALIAGLAVKVSITKIGFQIKFSGYNDKLPVLVQHYLKSMRNIDLKESRFQMFLEQSLKEALNFSMAQPYQVAMYTHGLFTEMKRYHITENIRCLKLITLDDLKIHTRKLLSETYIESLIHGNITQEDAINLNKFAENELVARPVHSSLRLLPRIVKLPNNIEHIIEQETMNKADMNSAVQVYYQISRNDVSTLMKCKLLSQLISEPCFDQLRTKEQLGYLVHVSYVIQRCVAGLRFIVQSSSRNAQYLDDRVEAFIIKFQQILKNIKDEDFQINADAVLKELQKTDKTLNEETSRFWSEIQLKRYHFDIREEKIKVLKNLTKNDVLEFFNQYILNNHTRKKLSSHVNALPSMTGNQVEEVGENIVEEEAPPARNTHVVKLDTLEYSQFRMSMPLYPHYDFYGET